MVIAVPQFISIGPTWCGSCHSEGVGCSTSYGVISNWMKSEIPRTSDNSESRFRYKNPFLGDAQFKFRPIGRKNCLSKVSVAADYPDSVPESSNFVANNGYHQLEEIKNSKRVRETKLTSAETAKTTIEANNSALVIFPGTIHSEPHDHISWAEYPYVIDDGGDIYFRVPDDANIMHDPEATNPVNVLIGMDLPLLENKLLSFPDGHISDNSTDDISFFEDYYEDEGSDMSDDFMEWGASIGSAGVHPIYFAKCLTKAANMEYSKKMDHPSNGVSILGCLSPAYVDEELYLRRLFSIEDCDGYDENWKDENINYSASIFYRLEIMRIDLFSVYGVQSAINLQDFRDAEPDILVHSIPDIIAYFGDHIMDSNLALKSLCKKNGFHVEQANIIGVDSLGMDVRVFTGLEVRTHRFPFKIRATSETAAEKQIQQLLFPRARRKRLSRTRTAAT
ncbi:putative hem oxygenase HugZ-like superfamily [Helianthus debilis subsp. tardiflorus]